MTVIALPEPPDEWDKAEKFFGLDFAVKEIARRAIEFNIVRFELCLADDYNQIAKIMGSYNGSLPMLISGKRYLCYYKLGPEGKL